MRLDERYHFYRLPSTARFPIDEELLAKQAAAKAKLEKEGKDLRSILKSPQNGESK